MLSHWYNHDDVGNVLKFKNVSKIDSIMKPNNLLNVPSDSDLNVNKIKNVSSITCNKGMHSSMSGSQREVSSIRVPWKIVILGDAGVGKSSLVKRFLNREFSDLYNPTVEDNYMHDINLPDGISQCIEILDTSGYYKFPAMKELNIRMATAFILVFDLTIKETLKSLEDLREKIVNIKGNENILIILVGNKLDKISNHSNCETSEKAHEMADYLFKCTYIEASAKYKVNISEVFQKIIEQILIEQEEAQVVLDNMNRRRSSLSFVRRFSLISSSNIDRTSRNSAPSVENKLNFPGQVKNPGSKISGKSTPERKKQNKNCVLS